MNEYNIAGFQSRCFDLWTGSDEKNTKYRDNEDFRFPAKFHTLSVRFTNISRCCLYKHTDKDATIVQNQLQIKGKVALRVGRSTRRVNCRMATSGFVLRQPVSVESSIMGRCEGFWGCKWGFSSAGGQKLLEFVKKVIAIKKFDD